MSSCYPDSFSLWLDRFEDRRYPRHTGAISGPVEPTPAKPKSKALLKALADIETRFGKRA